MNKGCLLDISILFSFFFFFSRKKKIENKQVFSVDSNQKSESIDLDMLKGVSIDFLYWFSGFTDAVKKSI